MKKRRYLNSVLPLHELRKIMATKKELGQRAENLAVEFLSKKSYQILERNWRFSRAEIDVIARHEEVLIFIEVKMRSYNYYGNPEDFVSERQQALIQEAAAQYMEQIGHDWEIRFDIISILWQDHQEAKLTHIKDAFF